MRTNRLGQLCFVSFAILGACNRSAPTPALLGKATPAPVIATFEGSYDPASGAFSVRATPVVSASGEALVAFPPWQDNNPGSGPDNTLELVTEASPVPGIVSNGCGGGVDSFEGDITVRSFYLNQTFSNVYIELTNVSTGHAACNSVAPVTGVGNAFGLWSYGTLGPKGSGTNAATRPWKFRYQNNEQFTFQGRIMANLGPLLTAGGPEFNWWPSAIVTPPHSFKDVATTTAHVVWNGSAFVDTKGLITFVPQGTVPPSTPVGLLDPAQPMVGPFGAASFFKADAAHGGNAIDTSGDFTACVKFKPGVSPFTSANKVILGKGQAEASVPTDGWALMQMHEMYCFHYGMTTDTTVNIMSYDYPDTNNPERYTFDYICGGRVGNVIHSGAHGRTVGVDQAVSGTFTNGGAVLPLVIGAYPDGSDPATDEGVYEVIFDSRGATVDVMNDIVSDAEGRKLPGSLNGSATYRAAFADGTSVTGADGLTYVLPPYATNPLASDGSGLLAEGAFVEYSHPLKEDTATNGFCLGAEIVADGAWSDVHGGFLHSQAFDVIAHPFLFGASVGVAVDNTTDTGWLPGSAHTLKLCVAPGVSITLYPDGVSTTTVPANPPPGPNLGDPGTTIQIGRGGGPADNPDPLTGARIRRVFVCPGSNPVNCN